MIWPLFVVADTSLCHILADSVQSPLKPTEACVHSGGESSLAADQRCLQKYITLGGLMVLMPICISPLSRHSCYAFLQHQLQAEQ